MIIIITTAAAATTTTTTTTTATIIIIIKTITTITINSDYGFFYDDNNKNNDFTNIFYYDLIIPEQSSTRASADIHGNAKDSKCSRQQQWVCWCWRTGGCARQCPRREAVLRAWLCVRMWVCVCVCVVYDEKGIGSKYYTKLLITIQCSAPGTSGPCARPRRRWSIG